MTNYTDIIVCSKLERQALITSNNMQSALMDLAQALDSDRQRDKRFINLVVSDLLSWCDRDPDDLKLIEDIVAALTAHNTRRSFR